MGFTASIRYYLLEAPGPDVGITSWGSWSEYLNCPSGVIGFKLRNEKLMMTFMIINDFTALNGIQLLCADKSVTPQLPGEMVRFCPLLSCHSSPGL